MQKILAVSGGIDSMVMLDFLCRSHPDVAWQLVTIDHGTRPSSATDAAFVARIAREKYHLPTQIINLNLGPDISEADARTARYQALFSVAENPPAPDSEIYLAHHLDDLCESITINLLRGTGWRGLAVMNRPTTAHEPRLIRPLLQIAADKSWVLHYAAKHNIIYREDPTNSSDSYLRNRLRPAIRALNPTTKLALYRLWQQQLFLSTEITSLTNQILQHQNPHLARDFVTSLAATSPAVADELLRAWLLHHDVKTTLPQRQNLLHALQTYPNGKYFNLPGDILLKINHSLSL